MIDDRHSRHHLFAPIGPEGQAKLGAARVAIVGCGALGSRAAELLGRAGAGRTSGFLRIIDRDYVDVTNLQRQALFDDDDARRARPKSSAAQRHLMAIDPALQVEGIVRELTSRNALELLDGVDLILDGTDNFRTRYLLNDASIALGTPWIYGGAVASHGIVATIVPGVTPCLRCLLAELPPLGAADNCDTAGIITPLPSVVAALQVSAAMRLLVDGGFERGVTTFDLWRGGQSFRHSFETVTPDPGCISCGLRELPALSDPGEEVVTLCGRNSVQIVSGHTADLDAAQSRMSAAGTVHRHQQSMTAEIAEGFLTLFDDGRVIVEGTTDPIEAKSIVARYLGG
jgi:molybdopterin/thiamine biosynthesis adenylyltransferase